MATFPGIVAPAGPWPAEQPERLSSSFDVAALTRWTAPHWHGHAEHDDPGALVDVQPTTPSGVQTYPGAIQHTTLDDFYNRIWVSPRLINVGAVTGATSRDVEVWNAYLAEHRTLTEIEQRNSEGITLYGPDRPAVFAPLQAFIFSAEVGPDGPASIDARFELVFTTPEGQPSFAIIGQRALEWVVGPNWAQPVEEAHEYLTEVLVSEDGTEQRLALRHLPRQEVVFTPLAAGVQQRTYQRLLAMWQHRAFLMADWVRKTALRSLSPDRRTLHLRDPLPELRPGGLLTLRVEGSVERPVWSRTLEIDSVALDSLSVTVAGAVDVDMPVGAFVHPAGEYHAEATLGSQRLTSNVAVPTLQFRRTWTGGHRPVPSAPEDTWRGIELVLRRPNWAQRVNVSHQHPFDWVDSGRGRFGFRTPVDAATDVRSMTVLCETRADVDYWLGWFHRMRGQRGRFFAPTWTQDVNLPPGERLPEGGLQLPVDEPGEVNRPASDRAYRYLYIRLKDGTVLLREVLSGGLGADGAVLSLDQPWPRDIERGEVAVVHYMPKWRSANDRLTVLWHTDGVAEITLSWRLLRSDDDD